MQDIHKGGGMPLHPPPLFAPAWLFLKVLLHKVFYDVFHKVYHKVFYEMFYTGM